MFTSAVIMNNFAKYIQVIHFVKKKNTTKIYELYSRPWLAGWAYHGPVLVEGVDDVWNQFYDLFCFVGENDWAMIHPLYKFKIVDFKRYSNLIPL